MRTSCITSVYGERGRIRDIESIIIAASRIGLGAIEIFAEKNLGDRVRHAGLNTTDEEIETTKKLCDAHNLKVSSISAHFSLLADDADKRNLSMREYKKCIDQAVVLDAPFVHGFSGIPGPLMAADEDRMWRTFRAGVTEVLDYARGKRIEFGIEAVIHHLVNGLESIDRMFDVIQADDLYLNYDPVHIYVSGGREDVVETIRKHGGRIRHVHIHDGHGARSFVWKEFVRTLTQDWDKFDPPGMGELDLQQIVRELRNVGYDGYLSLECIGEDGSVQIFSHFRIRG